MKKTLLSAISLAALAGSAFAADLPSRKEAAVEPVAPPMWTGFYAGLNAGGTWANNNDQTITVAPVGTNDNQLWTAPVYNNALAFSVAASANGRNSGSNGGFIGGGQIGYNRQFMSSLVAGLEADIQGTTSKSDRDTAVTVVATPFRDSWVGAKSAGGSLDYIGTVRGRLGWLAMPTLLIYGTGGFAYGGVTLNASSTVTNTRYSPDIIRSTPGVVNYSNTQTGWTAGGGAEWMFMPNWSAKAEYLYYDLGTASQNFAMTSVANGQFTGVVISNEYAVFSGQARARINGNIVRAGINYHFNFASAPVVAKF